MEWKPRVPFRQAARRQEMKKLIPLFFVVLVLVLTVPGCGGSETPPMDEDTWTRPVLGMPACGGSQTRTTDASLEDTCTRPADEMVMVYVPAGEFEMGSDEDPKEQPVHPVALDAFWIDQTEVTNAQFAGCVEAGACDPPANSSSDTRDSYYGDGAYDGYPVIWVNWDQAVAYCEWAGARLLTEAEWEYAARGPEGRKYPWGDSEPDCDEASYVGCVRDTVAVGSYPGGASWCGALDMAGNVWEWVADWGGPYGSEKEVNPTGPATGTGGASQPRSSFRVYRGGSWRFPTYVRSAYRNAGGGANGTLGFRCARGSQ
jgi:serine/threonine-protein kinase